jgi:hypothetical protein
MVDRLLKLVGWQLIYHCMEASKLHCCVPLHVRAASGCRGYCTFRMRSDKNLANIFLLPLCPIT